MRYAGLLFQSIAKHSLFIAFSFSAIAIGDVASAATHSVPTSTVKVDCATYGGGVKPGDRIILMGPSRGPISISNCSGTVSSPITVTNDSNAAGPLVVKHTSGGTMASCTDCEHVIIDGTGKWVGAPAGTCGANVDANKGGWVFGKTQCGIVLQCMTGAAKGLHLDGSTKHITVKGVEIDGNFPTCTVGSGVFVNDHNYKLADHPGQWREGIVLRNLYIHDSPGSGIYFGPNQNDEGAGDLQLRNNEIAYNYVDRSGCDGMKYKSVIAGASSIHHNYVTNTGLIDHGNDTGCTSNGIILFEAGYTDVYNNYVESPSPVSTGTGACITQVVSNLPASKVAAVPTRFFNNVVTNCKGNGIASTRSSSTLAAPQPTIFNNTVVAPIGGTGILVGSQVNSCSVRDNILAGESLSAGSCTQSKNLVGTVDSQRFENAASKDFRLSELSPAVNAGSSQCAQDDHIGLPRPQQSGCDIGAFEFGGVAAVPLPPTGLAVN